MDYHKNVVTTVGLEHNFKGMARRNKQICISRGYLQIFIPCRDRIFQITSPDFFKLLIETPTINAVLVRDTQGK